jgi:ABC-type glutathione transport system ATPase component
VVTTYDAAWTRQLCDRVLLLRSGAVVQSAPPTEIDFLALQTERLELLRTWYR